MNQPATTLSPTLSLSTIHVPRIGDITVSHLPSASHAILTGHAGSLSDQTGLLLWSAGSMALLEYLTCSSSSSSSTCNTLHWHVPQGHSWNVVELGCGTGLVSAALSSFLLRSGIRHSLVATDSHPDVISNAGKTLLANKLERCTTARIWDWSGDAPRFSNNDRSQEDPDIVVAAEIIYPSTTPSSLSSLFKHIHAWLAAAAAAAAGSQKKFVLSYVQRKPETTLLMLQSAFDNNLNFELVPWQTYAEERNPMDPKIIVFGRNDDGTGFQEMQQRAFPNLQNELEGIQKTQEAIRREVAEYTFPDL